MLNFSRFSQKQRLKHSTLLLAALFSTPFAGFGQATLPFEEDFETPSAFGDAFWNKSTAGTARIREVGEDQTTTDVTGASELTNTASPRLRGNIYECTTAKNLSEIETYFTVNAPAPFFLATLKFFVYESNTASGTYTRILDQSITVANGTGYYPSGPMNVPLTPGKFYLIGTAWSSTDITYSFYNGEHPFTTPLGDSVSGYATNDGTPPATLSGGVSTSMYRQRLSTHDGNMVLRMDDRVDDSTNSTPSATLNIDLDGVTGSHLTFRHRESSDETDSEDAVFLSVDGSTYHTIFSLDESDTLWHSENIDLDAAAATAGITLGPNTRIRFQQHDNFGWPSDGREFDDIKVTLAPDIFPAIAQGTTSILFKGLNINKSFTALANMELRGGSATQASITKTRYSLDPINDPGNILHSEVETDLFNIFAGSSQAININHTFNVPSGTPFNHVRYKLEIEADNDDDLLEAYETNNIVQGPFEFRINQYSGLLLFDDIITDITLTSFIVFAGEYDHLLTGSGTLNGLAFNFAGLRAIKNPITLDYVVSAADTSTLNVLGQGGGTTNGWSFFSTALTLDKEGLHGTMSLLLPDNISVNGLTNISAFTTTVLPFNGELNQNYFANEDITLTLPLNWYPECLPVRILSSQTTLKATLNPPQLHVFTASASDTEYVFHSRDDAFPRVGDDVNNLPATQVALPHNLQYFRWNPDLDGNIMVVDSDGANANIKLLTSLGNATFQSSFPQGITMGNMKGGTVDLRDGEIDYTPTDPTNPLSAKSYLEPNTNALLVVGYLKGCTFNGVQKIGPIDQDLVILPNGGLIADLPGFGITDLAFGAIQIDDTATGTHHLYTPGCQGAEGIRPEHLLNAAQSFTNSPLYYAGTPEYIEGRQEYAGLNVVPPTGANAEVTLGGTGVMNLGLNSPATKLYIRLGGVNGTLDTGIGPFAPLVSVYGYDFIFTDFGLNFIDSESAGQASKSNGKMDLPFPSNIDLNFTDMDICGCGELRDANPVITENEELDYWKARIKPVGIEFLNENSGIGDCTPGNRQLWLSSINEVAHFDIRPFMRSNIAPDGTIPSSEIRNRVNTTVDGYGFSLQQLYLNAFDQPFASEGFYNVVGSLNLPYFGNAPSLLHTAGRTGSVERLFITRGTDFTDNLNADADQNGVLEGGVSLTNWRNDGKAGPTVETDYLIRAKQTFAHIIPLDYPLLYNETAQRFNSPIPITQDLFILDTESKVKRLSPNLVQIDFGIEADFTQPISPHAILSELGDPTQVLSPISINLSNLFSSVLTEFNDLDALLTSGIEDAFLQQLKTAIQSVASIEIDDVINAILTNATPAVLTAEIDNLINTINFKDLLKDELSTIGSTITNDLNQLIAALDQVFTNSSGSINLLLEEQIRRMAGSSAILNLGAEILVLAFINDIPELVLPIGDLGDELADALTPLSAQIALRVAEYETTINDLFNAQWAAVEIAFEARLQQASGQLQGIYDQYNGQVSADQLKEEVLEHILRTVANQSFMDAVHQSVAESFRPVKDRLLGLFNALIGEVNLVSFDLLDDLNLFPDPNPISLSGLTGIKQAKLNGYGIFNRETFEEIHIDGEVSMAVPDDLSYKAALDIKRRHISSDNSVCAGTLADESVDATISAFDVNADWISPNLTIDRVALTFSFANGIPFGLHGALDMPGPIEFEALELRDLRFRAGIGLAENYLAAAADASFKGYDLAAGIFLGLSCDTEPLEAIDPGVSDLLNLNALYGIYARGKGPIPIFDAGCAFRVSAEADVALWYFADGPTYGGRFAGSFYGKLACVVGARGTLDLAGSKRGGDFLFQGSAWVAGGVGDCEPNKWTSPSRVWKDSWCYTCVAYLDLLYDGDWDVDYDVDCE